jgi:hypothetical protein
MLLLLHSVQDVVHIVGAYICDFRSYTVNLDDWNYRAQGKSGNVNLHRIKNQFTWLVRTSLVRHVSTQTFAGVVFSPV